MFVGTQKENEDACDEVRVWVEVEVGGSPLQFLISLCTPSFLLDEHIAGESQAISLTKQQRLNGSSVHFIGH